MSEMVQDVALQVVILLVALGLMWVLWFGVPRSLVLALRGRGPSPAKVESRRHFVQGAQLLGRSRSSVGRQLAGELAREAAAEADVAMKLDPTDAACHILKGLALERQGNVAAALACLDAALEPRMAKSLSAGEKSDALLKRAELKLGDSNSRRRGGNGLEDALADLKASVKMNEKNVKALCLLGTIYEKKEMNLEARMAFQDAVDADRFYEPARAGLDRLS